MEDEVVEYCLKMERSFYGLTAKNIKRMAFQLAIRNCPPFFAGNKKSAGRKWLRLFFKRHPELSLRKPQPLSLARIKGFSPENVKKFYDILKPELERVNFSPTRVFNVDETGVTSVQPKSMRVVSLKGKREVYKLSSAERGRLITIVACMSASGNFVPPMLVFPRKRMKPELMDGAPPGSIAACHISGWIQTDLFTKWFTHFISYVKPTKDDPVVLILDGHTTHTRNLDLIDLARENGVSLVCLPPHSSDHMQPLDKTFMKSFKTYYALRKLRTG
ncbi:MFS-type transporter clz9-like [Homalodisca vitripennis]|uniref:MFS-type transporter clz9-like n=1 Tax=Homalodisca vitripennis TaxID=197043 RepID=UPI001EEAAAF2|nr:MFS-type transporter clz9-like [Homalodisca vitripennis]